MSNNTDKIISRMQSSFPHTYDVYNKNTVLYALLSVFGSKYGIRTDITDRLYAMIGIDTTYDEDLEHRWGSLLSIYRQENESYNDYRNRLKIVYSSLNGGTAKAIQYAIAFATGLSNDEDMINKYIHVYDAWKYPYEIDESLLGIKITDEKSLYGSIICTVDLTDAVGIIEHDKIMDAINQTKASGINPCLIFIYGIIDESTVLTRNGDDMMPDTIKYNVTDLCDIHTTELHADIIKHHTDETISINTDDIFVDIIRYNTAQESINIKTIENNIHRLIQSHNDTIRIKNTIGSTAVFGDGVLGYIILGNISNDDNLSEDNVVDTIL